MHSCACGRAISARDTQSKSVFCAEVILAGTRAYSQKGLGSCGHQSRRVFPGNSLTHVSMQPLRTVPSRTRAPCSLPRCGRLAARYKAKAADPQNPQRRPARPATGNHKSSALFQRARLPALGFAASRLDGHSPQPSSLPALQANNS